MRQEYICQGVAFLLLCIGQFVHAQGLHSLETADLRLLYFDPTETYLVPRVIQTFRGSLARQRSILGYEPTEKTTILLKDFSDYGNAGALASPRSALDVAAQMEPVTHDRAIVVVGVAQSTKVRTLGESPRPIIHTPYSQWFSRKYPLSGDRGFLGLLLWRLLCNHLSLVGLYLCLNILYLGLNGLRLSTGNLLSF